MQNIWKQEKSYNKKDKYVVKNHHKGIISRDKFNKLQSEINRRAKNKNQLIVILLIVLKSGLMAIFSLPLLDSKTGLKTLH